MSLGYNQFVVLYSQLGGIAGIEGAIQHSLSHGVLHLILNGSAQWTCAIFGIKSFSGKLLHRFFGSIQMDTHGLHTARHGLEHPTGNLFDILLGQSTEHDDVVDTVQELGTEGAAQLFQNGFLGLLICLVGIRLGLFVACFKIQLGSGIGKYLCTDVAGHDDDGVLEVNGAALRIGDTAIVQNLEHDIPHILVRFFDFIEKHNGIGLAAHLSVS